MTRARVGSGLVLRRRAPVLLLALAAAAAPAGCGSSSHTGTTGPPAAEKLDPPARPLPGWRTLVNDRGGFSLSLPPGWSARSAGDGSTLVRSSDRALALSISADRSDDGARDRPQVYLDRTAAHLGGYRDLRIPPARPLAGLRYPAARAAGTGVYTRTGVRQALVLYALHRPDQVTYTLLAFRSAAVPAARYAALLPEVLRSFRARPAQV